MRSIKLSVTMEDDSACDFIIDDGETGLDIRESHRCKLDADSSVVMTIDHGHCECCIDGQSASDLIGLTEDEINIIAAWRNRKANGVSAARMGEILDKIVDGLDRTPAECDTTGESIVIKVEEP
jgi:hypothetical protein